MGHSVSTGPQCPRRPHGPHWPRGYQVSNEIGAVTFTEIKPGWYVSRTIHLHFRVRLTLSDSTEVNFTSQLFFAESVNSDRDQR